jgi:hypothetical protein
MAVTASPDKPRFRHDHLLAEAIDERGARFIDVMDPDTGNAFRFYESEFSLACAMDGSRDVPEIVQWAKSELGFSPSLGEVRTVIATLGELGYLEQGQGARATAAPTRAAARSAPPALATGVVVPATPAANAGGYDVELGAAGSVGDDTQTDLPAAPDFALGAPGAGAAVARRGEPSEDVALGAPGRADTEATDMSMDLSDHVAVRPDDVKEAVRASKVMAAVDVPKELLDQLEEPVAPPKPVEPPRPTPAVVAPPRPEPIVARPVPVVEKPVPRPEPVVEKPAIVARPVEKRPVAKPVEQPVPEITHPPAKSSPMLLILLVLVVLGAAAFVVWKYVLSSPSASTSPPVATPPVIQEPPPPPPKPPDPIKLALDVPALQEVKADVGGVVESVVADKVIKRDAVVMMLVGRRPLENEITALTNALEKRVKPEIAKLETDLAAPNITPGRAKDLQTRLDDRKKSLAEKEETLAKKQAALAKLVLKAPVDGELALAVKANARFVPGASLFTVTPPPTAVATFKAGEQPLPKVDGYVEVKVKDGATLVCRVAQADATSGVKVVCPHDVALDGKEVTLGAETAPPPPPTPPEPEPKKVEPRAPPRPAPRPATPAPVTPPPAPPAPAEPAAGSGAG